MPPSIADKHPEIPWKLMRDFRHVVVHRYFGLDLKVIWDTVQVEIPPLVEPLQRLLADRAD